jgi:hypothetical protein
MSDLVDVLRDTRARLADPGNDFSWSSWEDQAAALREMDDLIAGAIVGNPSKSTLDVLYMPTGPIQEVSLSSGWGQDFLELAGRYDVAIAIAHSGRRAKEVALSILSVLTTVIAWLFSGAVLVCWPMAGVALLFAFGGIFARWGSQLSWPPPLSFVVTATILVTFTLPIWGTHQGELRPRGSHDFETHSHPIWQLGHVH